MKKIYNKKSLWFGLFFLVVSLIFIALLTIQFNDMSNGKIISYSIYIVLSLLFGFNFIQESLSYKKTKKANQEQDEREELVKLKSASASIIIIQLASFILLIVAIIVWYLSRINILIGAVVAFGLIFNLTLFSQLVTYLYYNKKI